jgi:hypothetical protein
MSMSGGLFFIDFGSSSKRVLKRMIVFIKEGLKL